MRVVRHAHAEAGGSLRGKGRKTLTKAFLRVRALSLHSFGHKTKQLLDATEQNRNRHRRAGFIEFRLRVVCESIYFNR